MFSLQFHCSCFVLCEQIISRYRSKFIEAFLFGVREHKISIIGVCKESKSSTDPFHLLAFLSGDLIIFRSDNDDGAWQREHATSVLMTCPLLISSLLNACSLHRILLLHFLEQLHRLLSDNIDPIVEVCKSYSWFREIDSDNKNGRIQLLSIERNRNQVPSSA